VNIGENVQNYVKSLNFKYRVALREAGVSYLNKLGTFSGANSMTLTDKKGKTSEITAARFIVATGGRPTSLGIPGGEHAIDSDDVFALEKPPGRVLCIGAGYIALECGGFTAGLGYPTTSGAASGPRRGRDISPRRAPTLPDVPRRAPGTLHLARHTPLEIDSSPRRAPRNVGHAREDTTHTRPTRCMVRSILLRGFDRECVDKIGDHLKKHGVGLQVGVTPTKIEKGPDGVLTVHGSDGSANQYDTVLVATGRAGRAECALGARRQFLGARKRRDFLGAGERRDLPGARREARYTSVARTRRARRPSRNPRQAPRTPRASTWGPCPARWKM